MTHLEVIVMHSISNTIKTTLISATLLAATATPTLAVSPAAAAVDVLVARPIGFLGTALGAAFWTVTSPFTFINGTAGEDYDLLVKTPGGYTFKRPLGEGV
jgi:ABC-type sugar transport system substrate-binding protein